MGKILLVVCCWILGGLITAMGLTLMHTVEAMPTDGATWALNLASVSLTLCGLVVFFGYPVVILNKDI